MATKQFSIPFFWGLLAVAALLVLFIFLPELNVVVLGVTFAVLFYPFYEWMNRRIPKQQGLAAFTTIMLMIVAIFAPLTFFGFKIFQEAQGLYARFASGGTAPLIEFFNVQLAAAAPWAHINLGQYAEQFLGLLVAHLGTLFSGFFTAALTFFLSFFAAYYFLKDGDRLRAVILNVSPLPRASGEVIFAKLHAITSSIIRGSLVVALVYGLLVGIGFALFGVANPVLWGAAAVFASFIPIFGVLLIVVPGIFFLALFGTPMGTLGLIIWTIIMAASIEYFLRPWLIGHEANIHPLLLLFSILGGLQFFGPIGLILGPLALGFLLTLLESYPVLVGSEK